MSGYLFSERIVDRHRRWWREKEPHPHKNLAGKLIGPPFVEACGFKTPVIHSVVDTADEIPDFSNLPSSFVIKPSRGWSAKNIYVMVDGINQLDKQAYSREHIVQLMKDKTDVETDKNLKILIEEYLINWDEDTSIPPYDYKFFVFGNSIAFCHIIERNSNSDTSINRHWYVDENFESINMKVITTQKPETEMCDKPDCWDELVNTAIGLGERLGIFMRVDLYATTRGAVFGEFTPQPQGGKGFTPAADRWLGSLWRGKEGADDLVHHLD